MHRPCVRRTVAAAVVALCLSVIAAAPAVAQPGTANGSAAAKARSAPATATTAERQQTLARPAGAGNNKNGFKQPTINEYSSSSCIRGKTYSGKLRSGRTWTFTPTCLKIDTSRIGQTAGNPASQSRNVVIGPKAGTVDGLTPSSICPVTTTPDVTYDRFDLCTFVPWTQSGTLTEDPDQYIITVEFDVEMWAELEIPVAGSHATRSWTVDAIITPTEIINDSGTPFDAEVGLGCTDSVCTTTPDNGTPASGNVGLIAQGKPLTASFGVNDTANTATVDLNNVFQIVFLPAPNSGVPCTAINCNPINAMGFGASKPIRCDSQGGPRSNYANYTTAGCVVWAYDPTWYVDDAVFPDMGLAVKHMALATGNLPGYNGLPGDPGRSSPLTYAPARIAANRTAACGGLTAPQPEADQGNTSCDEYPLASTEQGADSGDPYSICWVPPTANTEQGTQNSQFLYDNRMLAGDKYYVDALYFGSNPGCGANLGGGGSIAPDNTLDAMFGSYGDNATCADWSGGDATNSVVLPNGERAWFFSDTYLNSPAARKGLWYSSFIHNSIVIQNGSSLAYTITGGNTCQETNMSISDFFSRYAVAPATAPDAGGAYWTGDQMMVGSNVVKFYYHVGAGFNIDHPAVATFPASELEAPATDASGNPKATITPSEFSCGASNIIWGTALLNWGGNIYVYGWAATGPRDIYVARTTAGDLASPSTWQVYDGLSGSNPVWGSCGSTPAALPISDGTSGFSVDSVNNTLWLVQFDYTNGQLAAEGAIGAHPATTPWGFGNDTVELYTPPTEPSEYPYYYQDYEARIQPGLGAAGQVVISYNVNTTAVDTGCVSANAHDPTIYRPRFIDVPVSDFNPAAAKPAPGTSTVAARAATAQTRTGIPDAASHGFPYGIHDSPPFDIADLPGSPPAAATPASATTALARSASASAAATTSTADGIDGSTDWFDGPNCPVIPAPANAPSLTASDGLVDATWQNVGTDVWYYVWICDKTKDHCTVQETTSPWSPAWPFKGLLTASSYLWTTGTVAQLDPIDAVLIVTGQNGNGDTFDIYVEPFGAGNVTCSANPGCVGSPTGSVTVSAG